MIVSLLTGWGLGKTAAKIIAYVGLPLVLLAAIGGGLWWLRHDAYNDGWAAYEADLKLRIERDKAAQRQREAGATDKMMTEQSADRTAAAKRKEEIDHATAGIPDQAPSQRQRARACVELRRQATAHGRPQPAC